MRAPNAKSACASLAMRIKVQRCVSMAPFPLNADGRVLHTAVAHLLAQRSDSVGGQHDRVWRTRHAFVAARAFDSRVGDQERTHNTVIPRAIAAGRQLLTAYAESVL
jgi:hypothetical protein